MNSKSSLIYLTKWASVFFRNDCFMEISTMEQTLIQAVVINHQLCMFMVCGNSHWNAAINKYLLCLMLIHATKAQHIKGGCAEAQTRTQKVPLRRRELHLEWTLTWSEWRHWVPKGKANIVDVKECTEVLSDIHSLST